MSKQQNNSFQSLSTGIVQRITNIAFYEFIARQSYSIHPVEACSLIFIDYGELAVTVGKKKRQLKEGQAFLIPQHTDYAFQTEESAVNVLLISFTATNNACLTPIYQKEVTLESLHRNLFAQIITESKSVFPQIATNIFQVTSQERMENSPFGAEALIYIYLSQLLIFMARSNPFVQKEKPKPSTSLIKKHFDKKEIDEIITYMEENLHKNISISEFSDHFFVSPSYLKKTFKKETGYSVINFYRILKMERAKQWVREGQMNFTEIACQLGYDTLHHFSNSFKKYTGLSPTAYKHSIHTIETKLEDFT
ncbi:helix-turn-helix domain-containing protein [Enterococcus sp. LJL98]